MKTPRNLSFFLKIYLIVGSVILVAVALYYNNTLIDRMQSQSKNTTHLFSRFIAIEIEKVTDRNRREFIREVRNAIELPFVLTDMEGRPLAWNEIGIPQLKDEEYSRILDFTPDNPNDPLLERVLGRVKDFDVINEPITVDSDQVSLVIHYGQSALTRELTVAPYIQFIVLVTFILFGFLGFRTLKQNEQRSIWVGMAKETAHQLGTPLSSIMGWLGMIRGEVKGMKCSDKLITALEETSADVNRLSDISARFSKIGSHPKLEYLKLAPIIEETVEYFERRRPSLKINSTISVDLEELPVIRCSRELLRWVFENLMKNSLDAIAEKKGRINIKGRMSKDKKLVEIEFADNGKGMSPKMRKHVFSPGVTSKKRGWGLGLALAKRIIEEIHTGKIKVVHSQPGRGTVFLITLPVN